MSAPWSKQALLVKGVHKDENIFMCIRQGLERRARQGCQALAQAERMLTVGALVQEACRRASAMHPQLNLRGEEDGGGLQPLATLEPNGHR